MYSGGTLHRTVSGRYAASGVVSDVRAVVADDADLAARFAVGDAETVRALYQRYGGLVFAIAYKVLGDVGLAEDATQQTFVQAWCAASTFDRTRALGPWLATIARRAAIDLFRRERRHRGHFNLDVADPALISPPPSPEQISDVWEVRQAMQHLPEMDRELIRLQHYGELTHTEIAQQLAVPLGTVKSRSYRAHRRLAELLGSRAGADTAGAWSGMANATAS
jgi:RNA polymerase sigma-70 factor (ECF subfamily)